MVGRCCRTDFAGTVTSWLAVGDSNTSVAQRTARNTGQLADVLLRKAVTRVLELRSERWGQGDHTLDTVTAAPGASTAAACMEDGFLMGGLVPHDKDGSLQWFEKEVKNKATGADAENVSVRYLGVMLSLGLDWSKNTSKLKSKVGCVLARLRYAGVPYTAICEVVQTMIASRAAFAAQVALVPEEVLQGWEETITAMILRDLGLTTASAKGDRRHFFYGAEREGGLGFTGLGDIIRAEQVMGYVTRRAAVGTVHCRIAQYQDAALARMVALGDGTGWQGTVRKQPSCDLGVGAEVQDDEAMGPEEPIWAMQRVHRALPTGAELGYAPIPWVVEKGSGKLGRHERGEGVDTHPSGLEQLEQEGGVVWRMQDKVRENWTKLLQAQAQRDELAIAEAEGIRCRSEAGVHTFEQFVQAGAERVGETSEQQTLRAKGRLAAFWVKQSADQHADMLQACGISEGSAYEKALAAAEATLLSTKAAELGHEWLEVYSDASVMLGKARVGELMIGVAWGCG